MTILYDHGRPPRSTRPPADLRRVVCGGYDPREHRAAPDAVRALCGAEVLLDVADRGLLAVCDVCTARAGVAR